MSNPEPLGPELKGIEAALSALAPAAAALDRDRLIYEAGRAARAKLSPWRATGMAASLAAALVVGRWSVAAPTPTPATAIAAVAPPDEPLEAARRLVDPASYFQLRHAMAVDDFAAVVPAAAPPSAKPAVNQRTLLHELLN